MATLMPDLRQLLLSSIPRSKPRLSNMSSMDLQAASHCSAPDVRGTFDRVASFNKVL